MRQKSHTWLLSHRHIWHQLWLHFYLWESRTLKGTVHQEVANPRLQPPEVPILTHLCAKYTRWVRQSEHSQVGLAAQQSPEGPRGSLLPN